MLCYNCLKLYGSRFPITLDRTHHQLLMLKENTTKTKKNSTRTSARCTERLFAPASSRPLVTQQTLSRRWIYHLLSQRTTGSLVG